MQRFPRDPTRAVPRGAAQCQITTDEAQQAAEVMNVETQVSYGGCTIRPIVTATDDGRFTASAVVTGPHARDGQTLGAQADFGRREEAADRAIELAIVDIDRRRSVPHGQRDR
ncbi:hypothetical protein C7405_10261 [Paraburkholderia caballeronis]|nr:hypothetical protein C7405_10261 [Paraburkholderia caballeronis]